MKGGLELASHLGDQGQSGDGVAVFRGLKQRAGLLLQLPPHLVVPKSRRSNMFGSPQEYSLESKYPP